MFFRHRPKLRAFLFYPLNPFFYYLHIPIKNVPCSAAEDVRDFEFLPARILPIGVNNQWAFF
jgi:hypothetical protein